MSTATGNVSPKNLVLSEFRKGSYEGVLVYDQIERIQAYLLNADGVLAPAEFVPPFANLHFTTKAQLDAFKASLPTDYSVRIAKLGENDFKVYLSPRLLGGGELEDAAQLTQLGISLQKQGKLAEALQMYQKCLAIQERLAPNTLNIAKTYNNIGLIYQTQGKLAEALKFCQRSLAIRERLAPNSLDLAAPYNNIGELYRSQGRLDEALGQFTKCLAIQERLAPDSLDVAACRNNIGLVYRAQGKLDEALDQFQRCLAIKERLVPNGLEVANSYNNIGNVYQMQGKLDEALRQYQRCLELYERLAPNSIAIAGLHTNIGVVYKDQGKLDEALGRYQRGLAIRERLAPNSLDVAASYNNIGILYKDQGRLAEALDLHQRSLAIRGRLAPDSLTVAFSHNNIGDVCRAQGRLDEALQQYQKSLAIRERLAPDSLAAALSYNNIGLIYQTQGKFAIALNLFQKAYAIRERDLIPKHPDLLSLGNNLAKTALQIANYSTALAYADKVIKNDPSYKYAYDIRGMVLRKQGNFREALAAFDQALACDPGYADASIHRLEIITEESRNVEDLSAEVAKAQHLPKTDYDAKKKLELEQIARAAKQDTVVELPKTDFEAQTQGYLQRIGQILEEHEKRLSEHGVRLEAIEVRMDMLDGRVMALEDSLTIIQRAHEQLNQKMAGIDPASPLLQKLLAEKARLQEREGMIKGFNRVPDQRHYFYALLSELEAAFLAAQVMKSGKLQEERSGKYSKAADYAGKIIELIPVVGQVVASLVSGVAGLVDMKDFVKDRNAFMRIRSLAPTVADFDQIALRVAVECTLQKQETLAKLRGAKMPQDWKARLQSLRGGIEGLMTEFLKDNETQAKVLGRLDAYTILAHLQEEAVAENYAMQENGVDASRQERHRYSLVALQIAQTALGPRI